ncbi:acyltransferase [bacterium]|nr:acyltransferase [bacterium]
MFGKNMTLRHPAKISIGSQVALDDNIVLDAKGCPDDKEFVLGDHIIIGHTSTLCSKGGSLRIGDNCNFGSHIALYSASDINFGKNILLGPGAFIGGGTYRFADADKPIISQGYDLKGPISIGDNCWFGAAVTVVDGVTIGENSILGAGAVVIEDIPPFSIAAGVPARIIRSRK